MGDYEYLSAIIPYTFFIYFLVVCFIGSIYNCCRCSRVPRTQRDREFDEARLAMDMSMEESLKYHFALYFQGDSFESTYQSCWGHWGMYLLLIIRILAFAYIFGISFIINELNDPMSTIFFTTWNVELLSLYFFLAIISSFIGICNDHKMQDHKNIRRGDLAHPINFWKRRVLKLGWAVQILFEVSAASAFFVTVIAFGVLDPKFRFWNVSVHFVTSMSMVAELLLNNINVRWEHVLINLTWALMYLIFCWPMVRLGALEKWPYFFLKTKTTSVFIWYIILIAVNIIFYYLLWTLSYLKYLFLGWFNPVEYESEVGDEEEGSNDGFTDTREDETVENRMVNLGGRF